MQKVTGIGGIFLKAQDPKALAAWYPKHLGLEFGDNLYIEFKWLNQNHPDVPGNTVFSFFKTDTNYFSPSEKSFMINLRMKEFYPLLEELKKAGVWVDEKTEEFEYGKFG